MIIKKVCILSRVSPHTEIPSQTDAPQLMGNPIIYFATPGQYEAGSSLSVIAALLICSESTAVSNCPAVSSVTTNSCSVQQQRVVASVMTTYAKTTIKTH